MILAQVFSCEFCEIFKNIFFHKTPLVAASHSYPKYCFHTFYYKKGLHTEMFYKMLGDVISNNREQINYNLQHARSFLRKLEAVIVESRFLLIVYHTLCFLNL